MEFERFCPDYIVVEEEGDTLRVVVPEGYDPLRLEELRFFSSKGVEIEEVLPREEFEERLRRLISEAQEEEEVQTSIEVGARGEDLLRKRESDPTVRFVDRVLLKAISVGASDVHFEPYDDEVLVRLRMDGVLHEYAKTSPARYAEIVSRIKIMANLNVAERRVPQDGKIPLRVGGKEYDVRVSVVPTVFGERAVLRILDRSRGLLKLEELGLSEEDLPKVERLISKPHGIVLITGPTGAGKSTTLYAMLLKIKNPKSSP